MTLQARFLVWLGTLAATLAAQGPESTRLDVVRLRNGEVLTGRIRKQLDGYLELELRAGASMGMSLSHVASVERAAATPPQAVAAVLVVGQQTCALHDLAGEPVGTLQCTVHQQTDGSLLLGEEYEFTAGARRFQLTSQVTATAAGVPLTAYFRERVLAPTLRQGAGGSANPDDVGRVHSECIRSAKVDGTLLHVTQTSAQGRKERDLAWTPDSSFPLLARALALRAAGPAHECLVYDPVLDVQTQWSLSAAQARQVELGGKPERLVQFVERYAGEPQGNLLWLQRDGQLLRREVRGPALVAQGTNAPRYRSAWHHVAGGAFSLLLPNPAWSAAADLPEGRALFVGPGGAQFAAHRLAHLQPGASLSTAADGVANWLALLQPSLRIEQCQVFSRQGRTVGRLVAEDATTRVLVHIEPLGAQFVMLSARARREQWPELAYDLEFALASFAAAPQAPKAPDLVAMPRVQLPVGMQ